ncbi:hypothetical protein A1O3_04560 [Capronia epimyces CBS 606.96]|uniref:Arginyl-tRNA synthetase catalytic core domain-containing protein n=1 Tax=Capronia epimyces CBS 606.96 TaxID=1182542 RepID=W9YZ79_9EURO|nr:uncharacterized protein A1O3_04560 [Capronia epimyces CBS 606.96]EXJ87599.1 hypothetical protein A1O3_04560 [Capronia epimyces CBS 606.96]
MSTRSSDGLQAVLEGVGVQSPIPQFPLADTQNSPVDIYLSYLADTLTQLTGCEPSIAYESIQWANDVGDLVVVLPRLRLPNIDPKVLSDDLQHNFPDTPLYAAPFSDGYNLRFFFDSCTLAQVVLPYIIDRGSAYGKDESSGFRDHEKPDAGRKKVVVEFSSPNLGQEFDGNHLRSTIIGAYIASIYESMGWDVCRMNFLGDWGKNIGLLAVAWFRFGSEELFDADPLKHLLDIYTKIGELFKAEQEAAKVDGVEKPDAPIGEERDEFFKKMEDGDPDAVALWERFRKVCVAKYAELYARLNVDFDEYSGESEVRHETTVEVETALKEKGVEEEGDEAWIINFKGHGLKGLGKPIVRHRNGTTSYLLRDVAAVLERSRKYSFDKMIYVVSAKQDSHFQQVFKALELMGQTELAGRLQHVSFGKSLGLSPNSGTGGLLLGDILDQCQSAVLEFLQTHSDDFPELQTGDASDVADALGIMALMTEDLSIKRANNVVFDLAKMATYDGYTGLTLQYWLDQVRSKLRGFTVDRDSLMNADYSMFMEDAYLPFVDVLRLLVQFPGIVKSSFRALESSTILSYLFRLVDLLPAVWDVETMQQGEEVGDLGEEQIEDAWGVAEADQGKPVPSLGEVPTEDEPEQAHKDEQGAQTGEGATQNAPKQDGPMDDGHTGTQNEIEGNLLQNEQEAESQEQTAKTEPMEAEAKEDQSAQGPEEQDPAKEDTKEEKSPEVSKSEGEELEHGMELLQVDEPDLVEATKKPSEPEDEGVDLAVDDGEVEGGSASEVTEQYERQDKGKQRAAEEEEPQLSPKVLLKVAFFECVRHVLENGMQMVGLVPM